LVLIGWTWSVYAVPVLPVAPSAGRLSDRYGRLGMMFVGGILVAFIWMSYGFITAFVVFLIVGTLEGSIDAVARSANDGYLADHSPTERRGQAQGLFNAATQLGMPCRVMCKGYRLN
jgi:MFS family permease